MITIRFVVNGALQVLSVAPETTLLGALRNQLGLTGAKSGCEVGDCGACTVIVDGRSVNACLMLAVQADGCTVLTIEGLATREKLHPLQRAFEELAALQCGFCGPGAILSAKALLDVNPDPSRQEVRDGLAGNLCRCTGYTKMIDAVLHAAQELRAAPTSAATHGER